MNHLEPKIYVSCLAAYNNGYMHGTWIDALQDVDALHGDVKKILASSPIRNADEWAIHDYEGFGDIRIEEYTGLSEISELAVFLAEHGELGAAAYAYSNNIADALKMLEENYHGEFVSEEDFAYYWTHEMDCREIPEYLEHYIDYQVMARDLFINDFLSLAINDKVHVFSYF